MIIVGSNASPGLGMASQELDASAPGMRERNVLAREEETAFRRDEAPV
jgi:hypothetical protein